MRGRTERSRRMGGGWGGWYDQIRKDMEVRFSPPPWSIQVKRYTIPSAPLLAPRILADFFLLRDILCGVGRGGGVEWGGVGDLATGGGKSWAEQGSLRVQ